MTTTVLTNCRERIVASSHAVETTVITVHPTSSLGGKMETDRQTDRRKDGDRQTGERMETDRQERGWRQKDRREDGDR